MMEAGHGAQVVKVLDDHTYQLDEAVLGSVLLRDDIKDLPVVVVSVAGAFRHGKSFLLNFFLRYLTSPTSGRKDGSWIGNESEPLVGFSWRSGSKRNTTGILLWTEPFIMSLPSGEKVAVLLMDTQGTFDSESTVRDCSTIFALSTLLSSVQIYNLRIQIQEDDLQNLQLFTEYGKMVRDQEGSKAFQVLEFLIRDWTNSDEYAYGSTGGELYLKEKLQITERMPQEIKELRTQINSCFEDVTCFLMPHPGLKVTKSTFNGNIADIDEDFKVQLKYLVSSLFNPEKLTPKRVNGEIVRARDLFTYFKTYMTLFNSNRIPNPTSVMEATVEAGMLTAVNEARAVYEDGMDAECGLKQPSSMPDHDVQYLHQKYCAKARDAFTTKKKMGSVTEANSYLNTLNKDLEKSLPVYLRMNAAKTQETIMKANEVYERDISNIGRGEPLCLHPSDLHTLQLSARDAATKIFDDRRKHILIPNTADPERREFLRNLDNRESQVRVTNEQNNNNVVSQLRMEYSTRLHEAIAVDPPLSEHALVTEHEKALSKALTDIELRRNRATRYTEDNFKYKLKQSIMDQFNNIKALNNRRLEQERQRIEEERRRERERIEEQWRREEQERLERQRKWEEQERQRKYWERREREERERRERERREREKSNCSIL